jgi:hypothetical protein
LKNAPEPLELWKKEKEQLLMKRKESSGNSMAFLATTVPRVIEKKSRAFRATKFSKRFEKRHKRLWNLLMTPSESL